MFNTPETKEENLAEETESLTESQLASDISIDNEEEQTEEEIEVPESDIHTMPNKFIRPTKVPRKKGKVSWLILGILAFIVLGGVIVVAVVFLGRQSALPAAVNQQPLVNQPPANENLNTNQNQNQNVNQGLATPAERDNQRLEDIANIRTALSLYFSNRNVYPFSLNSLVNDYLIAVPQDPGPEAGYYEYQVEDDQLNYQLIFELESGGVMGALKLSAGEYIATTEQIVPKSQFLANQNVNLNTNQNQNVNGELPEIPPIPSIEPGPTLGLDSDGDQLTDIEENIYQTSSALADTDGDGFTDATEILNFYDPTTQDGRLIDSGLIDVYQNDEFNYSLLYPQAWVVRSLTVDKKEVIFTSSTGEFIETIVQDNPLMLSAYNWYLNLNPTVEASEISSLIIDGLPAIQTPNGLTAYLAVGTKIYAITYNIGTGNQMNFQTTYQLFLKSFMFIEPGVGE